MSDRPVPETGPQAGDLGLHERRSQDAATDLGVPQGDGPATRAARRVVGTCREWVGDDRCNAPTEYVLWGKFIPAEGLGPRCYDHAAQHVGHHALYPGSGYAVIHLGELVDAVRQAEVE